MAETVRVAVRTLVETLRTGDLSFGYSGIDPVEAIRAHRRIQASRPEGYRAEVSVSFRVEIGALLLEIVGRMDGLMAGPGGVVVEEIKTTTRPLAEMLFEPDPLHWAQVKVYAYIYAAQNGLTEIEAQLTYCLRDTGETRDVRQTFTFEELGSFFDDLTGRYAALAAEIAEWRRARDEANAGIGFPYPRFRPGQAELAETVERAAVGGSNLLVQAPTGLGKTMAVLFGAIRAMAETGSCPIFYLTARTTGRLAAEDAVTRLRAAGAKIRSITITAKDKVCLRPETECRPEDCPYAKGYYDRLGAAVRKIWRIETLTVEILAAEAGRRRLCPFELSLDLALWADLIVCDYNYVFDPRVYLRRFFQAGKTEAVFLADEAHNLVERARVMFSARLNRGAFLNIANGQVSEVRAAAARIVGWFDRAKSGLPEGSPMRAESELPPGLIELLNDFAAIVREWLGENRASGRDVLTDVFFETVAFLRTAEAFGDDYATLYQADGRDMSVGLLCLDPSSRLKKTLDRGRAAIFFSATLSPMEYYRGMFGAGAEADLLSLPSPFPNDNLGVFVADNISTYFRSRDRTKVQVGRAIAALAGAKSGNYLIYFPSYKYLELVFRVFREIAPGVETIMQRPDMGEREREIFLSRFRSDNPRTLVGFAVMGGIFGEGVDLMGDRLTGAVIVGPGLPGIGPERDLIRRFFEERSGEGFEYAYLYPGLTRVFQAAGRVIRSENDRGVVLLIDPRFNSSQYRDLFPKDWSPMAVEDDEEVKRVLAGFWGE